MLKIHLKIFDHDTMFGRIKHSKTSNPVEYVLPCIDDKWTLTEEKDADIIFCSIYTVGYNDFENWVRKIKDKKKIIVGGYHPSLCPEDFKKFGVTTIKGSGESIINEAILFKDKLLTGEPLDVIPHRIDYSKIIRYEDKKIVNVRTFVGCDRDCFYCCHPIVYPKRYDFSLEKIIEDIEINSPDMVFITDGNFLKSQIFTELTNYCSDKSIGMRFYMTAEDLQQSHVDKINNASYSEVIFGLEKNISNEKEDLVRKLNSKKIGCIIKTKNNQMIVKQTKKRFSWLNHFSEMWLMPFPKTKIGKKFSVATKDYHLLNPKDAWVFETKIK